MTSGHAHVHAGWGDTRTFPSLQGRVSLPSAPPAHERQARLPPARVGLLREPRRRDLVLWAPFWVWLLWSDVF